MKITADEQNADEDDVIAVKQHKLQGFVSILNNCIEKLSGLHIENDRDEIVSGILDEISDKSGEYDRDYMLELYEAFAKMFRGDGASYIVFNGYVSVIHDSRPYPEAEVSEVVCLRVTDTPNANQQESIAELTDIIWEDVVDKYGSESDRPSGLILEMKSEQNEFDIRLLHSEYLESNGV